MLSVLVLTPKNDRPINGVQKGRVEHKTESESGVCEGRVGGGWRVKRVGVGG